MRSSAGYAHNIPSLIYVLLMYNPQGAEKFGFNVDADSNIVYREWAPNATAAYLIGDFSKIPNSIAPTCAYSVTR